MQYLYSILTLALQSLGQIFSLLLGWVIAVHFGRIPVKQKYILSAMGAVSLVWLAMALSLTSPMVRALFAAAALQGVPTYLKLIIPLAGIGWFGLPLVNGALGLYLARQQGRGIKLWQVLLGYKYTPGFALALVLMLLSLPLIVLPPWLKGLRREHLTIMIKPCDLEQVLEDVVKSLKHQGFFVELQKETLWRRSPLAILALFAHDLLGNWTKGGTRIIRGEKFKIVIQPTDLVIEGMVDAVIRVRNTLAKALTFTEVYFTWGGESNQLEREINRLRKDLGSRQGEQWLTEFTRLENEVDALDIPFNEWEGLFRQLLQLKVDYLLRFASTNHPGEKSKLLHIRRLPVNTMTGKLSRIRS